MRQEKKRFSDVWLFATAAFLILFSTNWLKAYKCPNIWFSLAPFLIGLMAFGFQLFIRQEPLIELYAKGYPYRKLKPYGVISAILFFEFVLMWGLHTKQIVILNEDLFLITIVAIGAIAYYHAFVRMKISLRFLFLGIFMPLLAAGAALGLGSYFGVLKFIVPAGHIGSTVFLNTLYWIISFTLIQSICEEPAFRGYILQRLLEKNELSAIVYSSLAFALWRMPFSLINEITLNSVLLMFCGNFIIGAILALLVIKGRNLLVAIISHGIIDGLQNSFVASSAYPGIRQYINFNIPNGETHLIGLWIGCLLMGLILLTFIPRKKI